MYPVVHHHWMGGDYKLPDLRGGEMKHLTTQEVRKRENDAGLVNDYYQKSMKFRTEVNKERYLQLSAWFSEKYHDYWKHHVNEKELAR